MNFIINLLLLTSLALAAHNTESCVTDTLNSGNLDIYSESIVSDASAKTQCDMSRKPMYRNIYGELGGISGLVGVYYDSRFKPGSRWGYRVGLGYSINFSMLRAVYRQGDHTLSVPFAVNGIFGKSESFFEAGFGFSPGVSFTKYDYDYSISYELPDGSYVEKNVPSTWRTEFTWNFFLDLGYRFQKPNGFLFRAGITPSVCWVGDWCCLLISPYVGFGYTFR